MNTIAPSIGTVLLAASPILILLGLMIGPRWTMTRAGLASWIACVVVAALSFGSNWDVLWVSQLKSLLLSIFVLWVFWPALLLYRTTEQIGGINAISDRLNQAISDRGLLWLTLAWCFSGLLEGLAGFGVPIAVVSPMLVLLGVEPITAVAAVAVGHAWSVTFGDVGVILQTLSGVVKISIPELVPYSALLLGFACLLCGIGSALILGQRRLIGKVMLVSLVMALVQYLVGSSPIFPLSALLAGLMGVLTFFFLNKKPARQELERKSDNKPLMATVLSYSAVALILVLISWPGPIRTYLSNFVWQASFPAITTGMNFSTPAGTGQIFRFWLHPGTTLFFIAVLCIIIYRNLRLLNPVKLKAVLTATWNSGAPATPGIIFTVGISTLMDHTGMTQILAQGLANMVGSAYPIVSPWIGMLGAFATGSNNNSNVLFAPLQKNVAEILSINPLLLIGSQTTGGSLGSMIAPAKIAIGSATVNLLDKGGDILRKTIVYGIPIGLVIGIITFIISVL